MHPKSKSSNDRRHAALLCSHPAPAFTRGRARDPDHPLSKIPAASRPGKERCRLLPGAFSGCKIPIWQRCVLETSFKFLANLISSISYISPETVLQQRVCCHCSQTALSPLSFKNIPKKSQVMSSWGPASLSAASTLKTIS